MGRGSEGRRRGHPAGTATAPRKGWTRPPEEGASAGRLQGAARVTLGLSAVQADQDGVGAKDELGSSSGRNQEERPRGVKAWALEGAPTGGVLPFRCRNGGPAKVVQAEWGPNPGGSEPTASPKEATADQAHRNSEFTPSMWCRPATDMH